MNISQVKISELSRLSDVNKAVISKHFKTTAENNVTRINNRIVGISPEAVEKFGSPPIL